MDFPDERRGVIHSSRDRQPNPEVGDSRDLAGENLGARRYGGGAKAESEGEWTPRRSTDTAQHGAHRPPDSPSAAGTPKSWNGGYGKAAQGRQRGDRPRELPRVDDE